MKASRNRHSFFGTFTPANIALGCLLVSTTSAFCGQAADSPIITPSHYLSIPVELTDNPPPSSTNAVRDTATADDSVDLTSLPSFPDFDAFVEAYSRVYTKHPDVSAISKYAASIYDNVTCDHDPLNSFQCDLRQPPEDQASWWASLRDAMQSVASTGDSNNRDTLFRFRWNLQWVTDASDEPLKVQRRDDVIKAAFTDGGIAIFPTNEFVGVATVTCGPSYSAFDSPADLITASDFNPCAFDLRIAFVITDPGGSSKFPSIFRTVGYDWVKRSRIAPPFPYFHEIFAISSLYKISQLLLKEVGPVKANDGKVVISSDTIDSFIRQLNENYTQQDEDPSSVPKAKRCAYTPEKDLLQRAVACVRVGNNSDFQLGQSRGGCSLLHWSGNETGGGDEGWDSFVVPQAFTPILPVQPTFVLYSDDSGLRNSIPCYLFTNWKIGNLGYNELTKIYDYETFPAGYRTGIIHSRAPGKQEIIRELGLRATAMVLYMLGFDVEHGDASIKGQWPREGFGDRREKTGHRHSDE